MFECMFAVQTGLVENIKSVVMEYKAARGLLPLRICMLGAPATGKSFIAAQVCEHYQLHHIKIADIIKESIVKLVSDHNLSKVNISIRYVTEYFTTAYPLGK